MQHQIGLVLDMPVDFLTLFKIHGFSQGRWKIDVPLVGSLTALNELNFGRVSHDAASGL